MTTVGNGGAGGHNEHLVGSRTAVQVPRYALYGDLASARQWFVNVEPLDQRAAAQGWTIEPHTHPKFTQLVFILAGKGEMTLDGEIMPFVAPGILVVPPFHIHSFHYERATQGSVITIENSYLAELLARAPDLRLVLESGGSYSLSIAAKEVITTAVRALAAELADSHKGWIVGAEIHFLHILVTLLRDRPGDPGHARSHRGGLVGRYRMLVEERYRTQPDIDEMAAALGVTSAQLRLACKAAAGQSPLALLHNRVVAEARRCLMYSSMSVAEIGYSLGYEDSAYFSRFLAKRLGSTPTDFRKALGS